MIGPASKEAVLTGLIVIAACGVEVEPTLTLATAEQVRVTTLGPIEGSPVMLSDGTEPEGVIWTVAHPEVVDVRRNRVVAVGPGLSAVTAEWEGSEVSFQVEVVLETRLSFVDAPSTLRVGDTRTLLIEAVVGEHQMEPGRVTWSTSDPEVLRVDAGLVTPILPGTAWITARARGASAMVELEVLP